MIDEKDCNNCAHHRQPGMDSDKAAGDVGWMPGVAAYWERVRRCWNCLDTPPEGKKLPHWQPLVRR